MALDMATALARYGYVGKLAQSIPELTGLLTRAAAEEWDSARFEIELSNTAWWNTHSEQDRTVQLLKATDPFEYFRQVDLRAGQVDRMAQSMGLVNYNARQIAENAILWNWSDDDLRGVLGDQGQLRSVAGGYAGSAGEIENYVRTTYANYGVAVDENWLQMVTKQVLAGRNTTGGLANEARNRAKLAYPQFNDQFDQGQTLADIASPYISAMASTLELSQTDIDLKDPYIKKALSGDGKAPMTMWQFERSLRDDARWQNTKQAKNETYSLLQQIGQDWGFSY